MGIFDGDPPPLWEAPRELSVKTSININQAKEMLFLPRLVWEPLWRFQTQQCLTLMTNNFMIIDQNNITSSLSLLLHCDVVMDKPNYWDFKHLSRSSANCSNNQDFTFQHDDTFLILLSKDELGFHHTTSKTVHLFVNKATECVCLCLFVCVFRCLCLLICV